MGIPKGMKLTDNPKNKTFKVRLDETTMHKLETVAEETNQTKADVIRKGIDIQYSNLKK